MPEPQSEDRWSQPAIRPPLTAAARRGGDPTFQLIITRSHRWAADWIAAVNRKSFKIGNRETGRFLTSFPRTLARFYRCWKGGGRRRRTEVARGTISRAPNHTDEMERFIRNVSSSWHGEGTAVGNRGGGLGGSPRVSRHRGSQTDEKLIKIDSAKLSL